MAEIHGAFPSFKSAARSRPCFSAALAASTCANIRGNLGRDVAIGPPLFNFNFSVYKNNYVKQISETFNVQFRAEMFNLFNHTNFNGFDNGLGASFNTAGQFTGFNNGNFGKLSSDRGARNIQFGLKFYF